MGMYNFDEIIDRKGTNSMNVEGWKAYIFGKDADVDFPYADDEFIRMWVADMDFAVAPEICHAIKERVDRRIFGYTKMYDETYFQAFENWCRTKYDWVPDRETIVFSLGVVPALYQLVEDLVAPGEKVLINAPGYGFFLHAAEYSDRECVRSHLLYQDGNWDVDWEDLERKAADPQVKMLIFCNPHNPTGRVWTEEELRRFADIAIKNDLWLVSDEIHCDLLRTGLKHIPMATICPDYRKLVTGMSASKTFNLAGMLMSEIMINDPQERERFASRDKVGCLNPLSIAAHQAAYEQGSEWLTELKAYLDETFTVVKEVLDRELPETQFRIPGATYFAWVDLRPYLGTDTDVTKLFAASGVLLEGGDKLFCGNANGFIRLNLAMPRSVIAEGLKRIVEAVKEYEVSKDDH